MVILIVLKMVRDILITGANGFVGMNLVGSLQGKFKLKYLVRDKEYKNVKTGYYCFKDYHDKKIEEAISGSEVIIHLAAMLHGSKKEMYDANVNLTKKLIYLAKKHNINHFIYISSENVEHGLTDIYTSTKKQAEKEVQTFHNHTILRPTVMYGPKDKKYVIKLIKIIKKSPIVPILGSGKNKMQFLYVNDLIKIIESSIRNKIFGTYVIAGPDIIAYNDFVKLLMKKLKIKKPVIRVPIFFLKPVSHILDKIFTFPPLTPSQLDNLARDREHSMYNIVKIFKYKPTTLSDGLQKLMSKEF